MIVSIILSLVFLFQLSSPSLLSTGKSSCQYDWPKNYVCYKLSPNTSINIDGRLDEVAWQEVSWTESFIDIQGPQYTKPYFKTNLKMRWDDTFLYVGAVLEEDQIWANMTQHDSVIFNDNDFEIFVDPDGSNHWYKELEINAINTFWDLILNKPYLDGGIPNWKTFDMPTLKSAVYTDCVVNDPSSTCSFWSVELALPFKSYVTNCTVATAPPKNRDQWRINFSRVEWRVQVVDGQYEKIPGSYCNNWVWTSQKAINMHLPEHWGFLQFSDEAVNSSKWIPDPNWPIRDALMQVYYAEKKFYVVNGYYTSNLTQLVDLPDYVKQGVCAAIPTLVTPTPESFSFEAFIPCGLLSTLFGHIRDDRLIWFTNSTDSKLTENHRIWTQ